MDENKQTAGEKGAMTAAQGDTAQKAPRVPLAGENQQESVQGGFSAGANQQESVQGVVPSGGAENAAQALVNAAEQSVAVQNASAGSQNLTEAERKALEEKKRKARAAAARYRAQYFAYYDDVKTKISEDW